MFRDIDVDSARLAWDDSGDNERRQSCRQDDDKPDFREVEVEMDMEHTTYYRAYNQAWGKPETPRRLRF